MIEFKMPGLGADMEAGILREWRVQPGDVVRRGDIIAEIETQKGLIEIEVFDAGRIEKLLINVNEKVPVGTPMALIDPEEKKEVTQPVSIEPILKKPSDQVTISIRKKNRISPLARKIAEENKLDYNALFGSGEEGAIIKRDVEQALITRSIDIQKTQGSSEEKNQNMRSAIAAAMTKSNKEIPHYYLTLKIDMSKSIAWLTEKNENLPVQKRILYVALLIKAVANSLVEVPEFNAVWENGLRLKKEINPGLVIALRKGGIVIPAIHDADKKTPEQIMESLTDLIVRSKNQKLKSSDLADSTISITSLGDGGLESVYGLIYPPQVALVGFGSIKEEPWAEHGMIAVRPVLTVTLAADHRATDGHTGFYFLKNLKNQLLNPEKL